MNKRFVCQECGFSSLKWLGKCPRCGSWNSFVEERIEKKKGPKPKTLIPAALKEIEISSDVNRIPTGIDEVDRVLGKGFVKGEIILLGGDPGIGKSTLSLQMASFISKGLSVYYFSGEESISQIKMRAERLSVNSNNLYVFSTTVLEDIIYTIDNDKPAFVVIDSVQTIFSRELSSPAGSVAQVREVANAFQEIAKSLGIVVLLIGHVTKSGVVAGPKTLEHIVDAVLYLEGDRFNTYRILRSIKNRFGSTDEIGLLVMEEKGLNSFKGNGMFLNENEVEKCVLTPVFKGSRIILMEIQTLISQTFYPYPQRISNGFPLKRLSMLIAVMQERAGLNLSGKDIYLNVAGGFKIEDDTGADLAVILSLAVNILDKEPSNFIAAIGEVGLGGEIRRVPRIKERVEELKRLGIKTIISPSFGEISKFRDLNLIELRSVKDIARSNIF